MTERGISAGWSYAQVGKENWSAVEKVPTEVHVELLKQKQIPDPFVGLAEWEVQWVGEADWVFKSTFDVSEAEFAHANVDIIFEGLDTFCNVSLNGTKVLETDNQFVPYRLAAKQHLKVGKNDLALEFPSAFVKGRELEAKYGKLPWSQGDSSRLYIRKAQYNYGWDWGPILMTVGPWRPIILHAYTARLSDIRIQTPVDEKLNAKVDISLTATPGATKVHVLITGPDGAVIENSELELSRYGSVKKSFTPDQSMIQLWWPVGYGTQPIYTAQVTLLDSSGKTLDSKAQKFGFRRVRVVEEPLIDDDGYTFLFEVNNVRIWCGGSNWIPADNFLTTMTDERYRAWLQLMVDGKQNMVRIWGGGIYEPEVFYNLCDELGLMVWQDFMFACGAYPAHDEFLETLKPEIETAVKQLRHHPSMVIFTGNNEDYMIAERSLSVDYNDETSDLQKCSFPARYIYERLMPEAVARLSDIHYHRSSPYSGYGKSHKDLKHGDVHQWNVWHGTQEPWHNWDVLSGRFVSEFGMQAYPNIRTVEAWTGEDKKELYPQSRVSCNHNKAAGFERRIALYLTENFKHAFDMESYIYYTQVMQAECLAAAFRLWRRNWKGPGRQYNAGALVWQINDCWPVTSWAIADYYLRPKPAFFSIARELASFTVGMARKDVTTYVDPRKAADFTIDTRIDLWGSNVTLSEAKVKVVVTTFDLDRDDGWTDGFEKEVVLPANQTTEIWTGTLPGQHIRKSTVDVAKNIVISAIMYGADGKLLSRYSNWPEPFKFITFPPVEKLGLTAKIGADGESVTLSTKKPIKGIVLDVADRGGSEVKWSDQAIDLVPGDDQVIQAAGLAGREIKLRYLGDGSA